MDNIEVRGARTHNLKNINLIIPRDKLIVVTGLSGSGKSSLAFDTLYAEGQRRYVESLSAYARQFLSLMEKPDVDHIEGLSPAISIEQKSTSHNPRSTVGTITEIHDYLRLLFARVGEPRCPDHHVPLAAQTVSQMVDNVLSQPEGKRLMLLAPVVKDRKGEHTKTLENLAAQGYIRARIDGEVCDLSDPPKLELQKKHTIEVVVDRFKVRDDMAQRLAESFETALELSGGTAVVADMVDEKADELLFSANFACPICGYSMRELEPRLFSFNNPAGACPTCDGLGVQQFFDPDRVVQNPELSLAGGAIRGWDRRNFYYFQMLRSLAEHYEFDVEAPFNTLKRQQQQEHDLGRRIVAAPAAHHPQRFTVGPGDRHAGQQAADRHFEEFKGRAAHGEHHGAHRHRDGELERYQAGRVIHQRLALEHAHDRLGNPPFADDAGQRHGIGRRQHRRQREGRHQRNARHHGVDQITDADHGDQHQHQRQAENFTPVMQELARRRFPAVGEQQRRDEQHQEQFGIKVDVQPEMRPGQQGPDGDLHQRQRHLERQHARHHPGQGDHQDQNEDCKKDFHAFLRLYDSDDIGSGPALVPIVDHFFYSR